VFAEFKEILGEMITGIGYLTTRGNSHSFGFDFLCLYLCNNAAI
jgi:hypothetical protein